MAKKKHNVILADRADSMLIMHTKFLAQVSPNAAHRLLSEFKSVRQKLIEDPLQFPFADEFDVPGIAYKTYRKCLFYGRYKAVIIIEDNDVYIDAVIDCRQENENIIL